MRYSVLWASIVLTVSAIAACADGGSASGPPPRSDGNSVAGLDTPEGRAMIELVLDERSISAGDHLTVRLVNRGDVPLLTGLTITDERWNGESWVKVEREGNWAWPMVGIILAPGQSTEAQTWPYGHISEPETGRYRLQKSARYEGHLEQSGQDRELVATATFEVTAG